MVNRVSSVRFDLSNDTYRALETVGLIGGHIMWVEYDKEMTTANVMFGKAELSDVLQLYSLIAVFVDVLMFIIEETSK
jgi:hypothetical protein